MNTNRSVGVAGSGQIELVGVATDFVIAVGLSQTKHGEFETPCQAQCSTDLKEFSEIPK